MENNMKSVFWTSFLIGIGYGMIITLILFLIEDIEGISPILLLIIVLISSGFVLIPCVYECIRRKENGER